MNKIYWAGYHPERSVQAKGIFYLKKKLEEIYPNNLEFKFVSDIGDLKYNAIDLLRLVEEGEIDCCYFFSSYLTERVEELNLFRGDTILIKGKKRKDTVSIIMTDDSCEDKKIRLNEVIRKNIGDKIGDIITIHAFSDLKFGKRIHVLPFEDTILDLKQNLFEDFLKPYFLDSYRPIKKGDTLKIKNHEHSVEFKIMEIDPVDYCIVGPDTIIYCEGEPLQREKTTEESEICYDNVGGCQKQLLQIRELVELPLRHPQLFNTVGIKPPRGVLMYGPPG